MSPSFFNDFVVSGWQDFYHTVIDSNYWIFIVVLLALQWFLPGQRDQRGPSKALYEDAVWFIYASILEVSIIVAIVWAFDRAWAHTTGGWNGFNLVPYIGVWGVAVLAFVIGDFLTWVSHWINHHVKTLWYFHAVHHSQANLNPLSDNREHVLETAFNFAVSYIPAIVLGLNSDQAVKLAFVATYWCAINHANLRTNFGPLRWIVVSPQYHRVHHSKNPKHYNSNYASIFSIWDRIFHTACPDSTTYPETGIYDETFPHESGSSPFALLDLMWRQTIYPFKHAFMRTSGYASDPNTLVSEKVPATTEYESRVQGFLWKEPAG